MTDRKIFFDGLRVRLFPHGFEQSQVDGLNAILDGWERYGDGDARKLAYLLATAYWETGRKMVGTDEVGHGAGHAYGQPAGPWHQSYFGRGLPQMTWLDNYDFANARLHELGILKPEENLVQTPGLANRSDVSVALLILGALEGWWTRAKGQHKLVDYFNDYTLPNSVGARHIINGSDHDVEIAAIYGKFLEAIGPAQKRPATEAVDVPPLVAAPEQTIVPSPIDIPATPVAETAPAGSGHNPLGEIVMNPAFGDLVGGVLRAFLPPMLAFLVGKGILPAGDYGAVVTEAISLITAMWSIRTNLPKA